jgi:hypothetical protein
MKKGHHSDAVVLFTDDDRVVFAVVLEVQLRWEPSKIYDWFPYVANLWSRRRCPTVLLVFVTDSKIAEKCMRPIEIGHPGLVLTPLVVGPDAVPVMTDRQEAVRSPELAVLSATTHGDGPRGRSVLAACLAAIMCMEPGKAALYFEYVHQTLSDAAKRELEDLMKVAYESVLSSELARTNFAKGEARAILLLLASRGIKVPREVHERITSCTDPAQLEIWVIRAASVATAEDLFEA